MNNINVGMGEMQVSRSKSAILVAPGLGSCIGVIMYDYISNIGGMVHVVLPDSTTASKQGNTMLGKYADTAIPTLLDSMIKLGAAKCNIVVKMVGGAQMFNLEKGGNVLNIGIRNTIAVKAALSKENLIIKACDTGGNKGRTCKVDISTGKVYVRSIGQQEVEL
ncbi:MAG: chemotaxis protein CheD [Candidatus Gastranaerophilales bacterium]|nr:chemotaxis protein CheD [Candidatus Gastranaerophilales bacterium]